MKKITPLIRFIWRELVSLFILFALYDRTITDTGIVFLLILLGLPLILLYLEPEEGVL